MTPQPSPEVARHGSATSAETLAGAVLRGSVGFAVVSLAGFAVWAFAGRWFYANVGEAGLYAVSALVFVGTAGLAMHPLAPGPRRILQFYKVFVPAFLAYAVAWCAGWFLWRFGLGEWVGSLAGSVAFALVSSAVLRTRRQLPLVIAVLFLTHSAGYFAGSQWMSWANSPAGASAFSSLSKPQLGLVAKLGWGLFYGLGFGAGIGFLFFKLRPAERERT